MNSNYKETAMKSTNEIPTTGLTTSFEDRRAALLATLGTPVSATHSSGDFAGDQESYRNEGGRPGAKNNKLPRHRRREVEIRF